MLLKKCKQKEFSLKVPTTDLASCYTKTNDDGPTEDQTLYNFRLLISLTKYSKHSTNTLNDRTKNSTNRFQNELFTEIL